MHPAPPPTRTPWTLEVLGAPAAELAAFGTPAPQGSKRHVGGGRMIESSKKLKPWRSAVHDAAHTYWGGREPLDGPLVADLVFTMPKGTSLPKWLIYPFKVPDLSKLARSTEDALTTAGLWHDDARVVAYRRLEKTYAGAPDPDTLPASGVVIRVWPIPADLINARRNRRTNS